MHSRCAAIFNDKVNVIGKVTGGYLIAISLFRCGEALFDTLESGCDRVSRIFRLIRRHVTRREDVLDVPT